MNIKEQGMSKLAARLGYWSALLCCVTFVIFTVCFVAILIVNPLFTWTNLSDFITHVEKDNQFYKYLAQFSMLIFAALYVVLVNSIHEYAKPEQKILTRLGIHFGIAFMVAICINYFVQISAIPLSIEKGQLDGLTQFIQANPTSGVAAINMLGWTFFFALSNLFIAPVFSGGRLEKVIKISLVANALICLLGGVGYIMDNALIVGICMNLGMGGAIFVASIALCMFFKRVAQRS